MLDVEKCLLKLKNFCVKSSLDCWVLGTHFLFQVRCRSVEVYFLGDPAVCSKLNVPVLVEWPSFIVQRVAENGAAVVPSDTVVQLYIVVLLGTLWFHFCVACGPVFILLCPVVPCVTLGLVVFAQWCRVLHWGLYWTLRCYGGILINCYIDQSVCSFAKRALIC